ncbi:MAG: mevalonate kinase [Nanoarchaeota archaeon]|nr:mevalonate kinase [Nanoarchaeota archaeon]
MVTVSAPGKVHLIGEHSVVYGEPAIIAAIGLQTTVTAEKAENVSYLDKRFSPIPREWSLDDVVETTQQVQKLWDSCKEKGTFSDLFAFVRSDGYSGYRKAVVGITLHELGIHGGVSVTIDGAGMVGAGIGSSSSLAVALVKAIATVYEKSISLERVNDIAFKLEQVIHGTPSGGDNAACCFGGLIWFRKNQPKNDIISLKDEIPHKLENFVLVYTGPPEKNTGELVQLVKDKPEDFRTPRVKALGEATVQMKTALKNKDYNTVRTLMNLTQKTLAELGVSTPTIDKIAEAVRDIGGAAKLCGAGGGGIMLCHHADRVKLAQTITNLGFEPIEVDLGVEGVKL